MDLASDHGRAASPVRGTFDPPHAAHGRLPQLAGEAIGASRGLDPRRPEPTSHRAVRAAGGSGGHAAGPFAGNADAEIDQRELQRGGPVTSWTPCDLFGPKTRAPASILDRCGPRLQFSSLAQLGTDLGFGPSGHRAAAAPRSVGLELVLEQLDEGQSRPGLVARFGVGSAAG